MKNLPFPLAAYILATATVALAVAVAAALDGNEPAGGRELYYMAALAALVAAASHFPLHIGPRAQIYMDTAPVIAAVILLPPPLALATCALGKIAANSWSRTPVFQALFNVSTMAVQAGLASMAYHGLASERQWEDARAMVVASFVLVTTNACLVEGIVSIHVGKWPFAGFWSQYGEDARHQVALLMLGVFAALIAEARPWALPLLTVPSAVVYRSLRYQHLTLKQSEASKTEAEEARARLTAIVEATPDFVATADPAGRVLYLNRAGRQLVGLTPEADLGEMQMSEAFGDWEERAGAALRDGSWMGESSLRGKKGEMPVSQVVVVHRAQAAEVDFVSTVARDIRERKRFEARLVQMANSDPLTGLLNRRSFDSELSRRLRNTKRPGAVLFVDLDEFKRVNDRFGHAAGDQLLVGLAGLMRTAYPGRWSPVGRLGGDEFGVFLPGVGAVAAEAAAAGLVARIAAYQLMVGGRAVGLTASVGVSLFPKHGTVASHLIAHADTAMYRAKAVGNCHRLFEPGPPKNLSERRAGERRRQPAA